MRVTALPKEEITTETLKVIEASDVEDTQQILVRKSILTKAPKSAGASDSWPEAPLAG